MRNCYACILKKSVQIQWTTTHGERQVGAAGTFSRSQWLPSHCLEFIRVWVAVVVVLAAMELVTGVDAVATVVGVPRDEEMFEGDEQVYVEERASPSGVEQDDDIDHVQENAPKASDRTLPVAWRTHTYRRSLQTVACLRGRRRRCKRNMIRSAGYITAHQYCTSAPQTAQAVLTHA